MIRHAWRVAAAGALLCAAAAVADTRFTARRMTRRDVPLGKGQCDIRLFIDDEVEVQVRGDNVWVRELRGGAARDAGSECNKPLPLRPEDFGFEVRDGRGEVRLLDDPSRSSRGAAVVAIRDGQGGAGRYHFRLTWADRGTPPRLRRDRR